MCKRLGFLVVVLFFVACNRDTDPAHKSIETYILQTNKDIADYDPIEWGTPDSLFKDFASTPEYKQLKKAYKTLGEREGQLKQKLKALIADKNAEEQKTVLKQMRLEYKQVIDSTRIVMENILHKQSEFKQTYAGWIIDHKYEATDKNGSTHVQAEVFFVDTLYRVMGSEPAEKTSL